jgi:hypothetical protein
MLTEEPTHSMISKRPAMDYTVFETGEAQFVTPNILEDSVSGLKSLSLYHSRLYPYHITSATTHTNLTPRSPRIEASNMCTTFRVYYYCGHLKRTTYIEHSGIECTETDSKRTVVDEKCPRCVARKPLRDDRLQATLDGNDTPSLAREDAFYNAGDKSSGSEQDAHIETKEESGQIGG